MAKNDIRLEITADAQQALGTLDATTRNISKLSKEALSLEKNSDGTSKSATKFNNALLLLQDVVKRNVDAQKLLNNEIDMSEKELENWGKALKAVSTKGGVFGSDTLQYIQNQMALLSETIQSQRSVMTESEEEKQAELLKTNELIKKQIELTQNATMVFAGGRGDYNAMGVKYKTWDYTDVWKDYITQLEKAEAEIKAEMAKFSQKAFGWATGQGDTNAMGLAYRSSDTYSNVWVDYIDKLEKETIAKLSESEAKIKAAGEEFQNKAFSWATGKGDTNAMGQAYKSTETYEEMWDRLIKKQDAVKNATNGVSSSFGNWAKKMLDTTKNVMIFRFIMNLVNSISQFKQFLSEASAAAAEAEQNFSKLNTVFGETSNALSKAIDLSSKIGVATSTAANSLSTVGDLLQAQGMTTVDSLALASEWVEKFNDIIAFKDINMSLDEFAENFMSGAAGNLRNFRSFGSIVRESAVNAELAKRGLDKLSGSQLELEKMTIRAEMALEQQKNAIGATSREWDTMLSINRRYEESLKSLKENTGEQMKPLISWWTKLKTSIVDALNANMEFSKKVEVVLNGGTVSEIAEEDKGNLERTLKDLFNQYSGDGKYSDIGGQIDLETFRASVATLAMEYGKTQEDIDKLTAELIKKSLWDRTRLERIVEAIDGAVDEYIDKANKQEELAKLDNAMLSAASSADNLFESMQAINGVSFSGTHWYQMFTSVLDEGLNGHFSNSLKTETAKALSRAIPDAISDIGNLELSTVDKLFTDDAEGSLLQKRIDAYQELYEIAYSSNQFEESALLDIVDSWEKATIALSAYNAEKAKQERIATALSNQQTATANYEKQLAQLGMSASEKTLDDLNTQWLNAESVEVQAEISKTIDAFKALTEATEKQTKEAERLSKLEEYQSSTAGYEKQIATYGLSSYEAEKMDLIDLLNSTEDKELYDELFKSLVSLNTLIVLERKDKEKERQDEISGAYSNLFGELGTIFDSIGSIDDIMNGAGDLLLMLSDILAQTEVFAELMSYISDITVPILNDFLKPLIPTLEALSALCSLLLVTVLEPFFPLLKGLAAALTTIFYLAKIVINFITDSFKWMVGTVVGAIDDMIAGIVNLLNKIPYVDIKYSKNQTMQEWRNINPFANVENTWNEMNESLDEIANMTFGIAKDTKDIASDDFDTIRNLYAAGELSREQFTRLTGQNRFTSSTLNSGVQYTQNKNQSYISIQSLNVQIPEGMSFEEFMNNLELYTSGNAPFVTVSR